MRYSFHIIKIKITWNLITKKKLGSHETKWSILERCDHKKQRIRHDPTDKPTMTNMYFYVWLPTLPKLTARPASWEFIAPGITPPTPTRHGMDGTWYSPRLIRSDCSTPWGHTSVRYTDSLNANLTFNFLTIIYDFKSSCIHNLNR